MYKNTYIIFLCEITINNCSYAKNVNYYNNCIAKILPEFLEKRRRKIKRMVGEETI